MCNNNEYAKIMKMLHDENIIKTYSINILLCANCGIYDYIIINMNNPFDEFKKLEIFRYYQFFDFYEGNCEPGIYTIKKMCKTTFHLSYKESYCFMKTNTNLFTPLKI